MGGEARRLSPSLKAFTRAGVWAGIAETYRHFLADGIGLFMAGVESGIAAVRKVRMAIVKRHG
jgi:hypothetical protein